MAKAKPCVCGHGKTYHSRKDGRCFLSNCKCERYREIGNEEPERITIDTGGDPALQKLAEELNLPRHIS